MERVLPNQFRNEILRQGGAAVESPRMVIGTEGRYSLRYVPFEHVSRAARLAIVGISPGPNQMAIAYDAFREAAAAGLDDRESLRRAKRAAGFGGPLRDNLARMIEHFGLHRHLGLASALDLWGDASDLLHATSVIPHAAFDGGKPFAGPFEAMMASPLLRGCFERDFVPSLALLPADALFVALGPMPQAALLRCAAEGHIRRDMVLGSFAHPSGNGGTQVRYYLREIPRGELNERDPVRHRAGWLDAAYAQMRASADGLRAAPAARPASPPSPAAAPPAPAPAMTAPAGPAGLHAVISRGRYKGVILRPHVHEDGSYVVSASRFEEDYVHLDDLDEVEDWLDRGYSLRMSNRAEAPDHAPSLIVPASIRGRRAPEPPTGHRP